MSYISREQPDDGLPGLADDDAHRLIRANAAASAEFAAAAALSWHAQLAGRAPRLGADFRPHARGPLALRDSYFAAGRLRREGGLDPLLRGLWAQPAAAAQQPQQRGSYAGDARSRCQSSRT